MQQRGSVTSENVSLDAREHGARAKALLRVPMGVCTPSVGRGDGCIRAATASGETVNKSFNNSVLTSRTTGRLLAGREYREAPAGAVCAVPAQ